MKSAIQKVNTDRNYMQLRLGLAIVNRTNVKNHKQVVDIAK